MQCFEGGQVIVLPREGGADDFIRAIREGEGRFRILYAIEDILSYYELRSDNLLKQFGAVPFVAQVPEGEELESAEAFRANNLVKAAIPNFHVTPLSIKPHINKKFIEDIITELRCSAPAISCGNAVKIAVIDTGVNPSVLSNPGTLYPRQYATDCRDPSRSTAPIDPLGHGTTVAYIVNAIAPGATILSIKMMEKIGNIGGLIAALYLAEAEFQPDIYNLSLALTCDSEICGSCGNPIQSAINADQLRFLFSLVDKRENLTGDKPLLIAAAGNGGSQVRMPACFENILAVGSFDTKSSKLPDYSRYSRVHRDRFILAPGGEDNLSNSMSYIRPSSYDRQDKFFFGTSFSAAFVTGIAARFLCATKDSPCRGMSSGASIPNDLSTRQYLMDRFESHANRGFKGYAAHRHGIGLVQYSQ